MNVGGVMRDIYIVIEGYKGVEKSRLVIMGCQIKSVHKLPFNNHELINYLHLDYDYLLTYLPILPNH